MIKKLRIRIVCISMAIVIAMLSLAFLRIYNSTRKNLSEESLSMMMDMATQPTRFGRFSENYNDMQLPFFTVILSPLKELVTYTGGYYDFSDIGALKDIIEEAINSDQVTGLLQKQQMRFLKVNNLDGSQTIVFADISSHYSALELLSRSLFRIAFLTCAVFLIISIIFSKWAVKPVERAWNQQRKFVGDASHELKTPLTVITTNAELLMSADSTEEEKQKYTGNILNVSKQMRSLVEDLLNLARADDGKDKESFERISFSSIVSECSMEFEPVFFEKGLTLSESIKDNIYINGNAQRIKQLANILLDNACKYSDPGETQISLESVGRNAVLTVSNPGRELSSKEATDIFNRFYRADESRNTKESFGLGLSIAESFADEHGGSICAEGKDGRNYFTVKIPKA